MSFRFYITDLFNGEVVGTNDIKRAEEFALVEDYFVIEPKENLWYLSDSTKVEISSIE